MLPMSLKNNMNINLIYDPEVDVNEVGTLMVQVMKRKGKPVARAWIQSSATATILPVPCKKASFLHLIQHPEPERLIQRMHALIDGRSGADVGCVLLKCIQENWLIRNPTKAEFCAEFELIGSWQSIHKYMDENNLNALTKANRIVIF